MTRSAGHIGFIFWGSPPSLLTASLIAAKSTTAGTPLFPKNIKYNLVLSNVKHTNDLIKYYVKSCSKALDGKKGISTSFLCVVGQFNIFFTSLLVT